MTSQTLPPSGFGAVNISQTTLAGQENASGVQGQFILDEKQTIHEMTRTDTKKGLNSFVWFRAMRVDRLLVLHGCLTIMIENESTRLTAFAYLLSALCHAIG